MNVISSDQMRIIRTIDDIKPTNSSNEIIFKHYLKDNYPDNLFLIMPCIHEILAKNLRGGKSGFRLTKHLQQFVNLLKTTVPKTTQIFWVPSQYFFWADAAKIRLCNKVLFDTLKDEFAAPNSNIHATLDVFELGCSMRRFRLKNDRPHMARIWYTIIARHLIEQICN